MIGNYDRELVALSLSRKFPYIHAAAEPEFLGARLAALRADPGEFWFLSPCQKKRYQVLLQPINYAKIVVFSVYARAVTIIFSRIYQEVLLLNGSGE
jgi:hypothetical protein